MFGYVLMAIVPAGLMLAGLFVFGQYKLWAESRYLCPDCGEDFAPASFFDCLMSYHPGGYRRLACPECGHRELMKGTRR